MHLSDVTIGFIGAPYSVSEESGPITITIGVIGNATLSQEVVVSFSTEDLIGIGL